MVSRVQVTVTSATKKLSESGSTCATGQKEERCFDRAIVVAQPYDLRLETAALGGKNRSLDHPTNENSDVYVTFATKELSTGANGSKASVPRCTARRPAAVARAGSLPMPRSGSDLLVMPGPVTVTVHWR